MARKSRGTRTYVVPELVKLLSFIAVMLMGLGIAVGVLLGRFGGGSIGSWIERIAIAIGLIALCWYSFYYARYRGTVWFVLWIIAVILIIVFYVLGLFW